MNDAAPPPVSDPQMEASPTPVRHEADPWLICVLLSLAFAGLAGIGLAIPSTPYFDEVHYLPAAREMLEGGSYRNQEHPLLGKQLLGLGIAIFGDAPLGWRVMPLLAGMIALYASMRTLWFATLSRFAAISFGALLASGFALFIHSRIAMLDIFMVASLALAAWQFTAAIREPETARWRLAVTGMALGCAMASKWNAIPIAILPGLVFLCARIAAERRRLLTSKRGIPVPGISLLEATVWLGVLPVTIYFLTFLPAWKLQDSPLPALGLIGMQKHMLSLQTQVLEPHPYQSTLGEWITNWRAIWYLYEDVDGAQRGIMLIGNPLTMIFGLAALVWCTITGLSQRSWTRVAVVVGYLSSIGLWLFAEKSVQFYYHYFVPSCFLLAALALALDAAWKGGHRKLAGGVVLASLALFAWFYPIISGAELEGPGAFATWTWLDSWR